MQYLNHRILKIKENKIFDIFHLILIVDHIHFIPNAAGKTNCIGITK